MNDDILFVYGDPPTTRHWTFEWTENEMCICIMYTKMWVLLSDFSFNFLSSFYLFSRWVGNCVTFFWRYTCFSGKCRPSWVSATTRLVEAYLWSVQTDFFLECFEKNVRLSGQRERGESKNNSVSCEERDAIGIPVSPMGEVDFWPSFANASWWLVSSVRNSPRLILFRISCKMCHIKG